MCTEIAGMIASIVVYILFSFSCSLNNISIAILATSCVHI